MPRLSDTCIGGGQGHACTTDRHEFLALHRASVTFVWEAVLQVILPATIGLGRRRETP